MTGTLRERGLTRIQNYEYINNQRQPIQMTQEKSIENENWAVMSAYNDCLSKIPPFYT